ncbi:MAG: hypothetical protein GY866_13070 [Proteobacteria bacterium]|nr:hypothetical protein [Pseudomonadota bacterium]
MKSPSPRNHHVGIPIHWTPEQADAVFDFIALLESAIWDLYGENLTEIARQELLASRMSEAKSNDDFDDLPF